MKSRHKARETALQILYQYDLATQQTGHRIPTGSALTDDLRHHYDHFEVSEGLRHFVGQLVAGTLQEIKQLDPILESHAANWTVARMSSVDRSLLRMAAYEMLYLDQNTDRTIIIDEAIELAKQFGTAESPSFVNGILDSMKSETVSTTVED